MSNSKKITELTSYTAAEVQSTDPLFITDLTNQETKKITSLDFATYAINAKSSSIYSGSYNGRFTGSFSGSYVGNLTGTASYATTASYALSGGTGGSSGEVNTASNIGTSGIGLFKQKSGVDLQFKNLVAGTSVSFTENSAANTVEINLTSTESPGGPSGAIQFNGPGSVFDGNANLSWDTTNNNRLTVVGGVSATSFTSSITNAIGFLGTSSYSSASLSSSYAPTSSYAVSSSNASTASYFNGTGAILSAYSVLYYTQESGQGTTWYDTGLSITITPKSTNSKFLINASIVLSNGPVYGCAVAGLFKNSTTLIDRFASVEDSIYDANPSCTTYLDAATDLSPRTYIVKVKGDDTPSYWYTNRSPGYPTLYYATSSMTILEFNI